MQYCRLCRFHARPGLHELPKLFDPSNPSTYQIFAMIFLPLRFSKCRSPHCIFTTLKLLHPHCHLCCTNMLHSKTFRVHPRLNHSSLLTFDRKRSNAQSWKPFTVERLSDFQSLKSNRSLFKNSYSTLAAHITAHSF